MTGGVEDVREHYAGCSVALVPELMGGGFKLKVLEAAALRKAMVRLAGDVTAPGFVAGTHYIEAADFDDLAQRTVALMSRPEEIRRLSDNAHALVRERYSWRSVYERLIAALELVTA
jgi:glycosyltransferase involved in cell wall biosynthesis